MFFSSALFKSLQVNYLINKRLTIGNILFYYVHAIKRLNKKIVLALAKSIGKVTDHNLTIKTIIDWIM